MHPDGTVRWERTGPQELAKTLDELPVFDRTFHLVGNHLAEVEGDTAAGTVHCLAHHCTAGSSGGGGTDEVVPLRYEDTYARTAAGRRIVTRAVHLLPYERRDFPAAGA